MSRNVRRSLRQGLVGATLASALLAVATSPALGDSSQGSTIAHIGVSPGIALSGLTSSFTLTGTPGATVTDSSDVAFNVQTNNAAGYTVTVQSVTGALQPALPGNPDSIPIGALTVRQSGAGAYFPLSNATPVTIHSQPTRSLNGGDNLSNDFQIKIPVVNADTYSATLNYVASTL